MIAVGDTVAVRGSDRTVLDQDPEFADVNIPNAAVAADELLPAKSHRMTEFRVLTCARNLLQDSRDVLDPGLTPHNAMVIARTDYAIFQGRSRRNHFQRPK